MDQKTWSFFSDSKKQNSPSRIDIFLEWGKCFIMATEIKPGLYPTLQIRNIVINNISKILKILFLFFSQKVSKQFQYEGQ